MRLRALRGAITVEENTADAILDGTEELLRAVMERNALSAGDLVSCIFTTTGDLILTFFNARRDYLQKLLPVGARRYVSGATELYDGMLQMVHPDRVVDETDFDCLPLVERSTAAADAILIECKWSSSSGRVNAPCAVAHSPYLT